MTRKYDVAIIGCGPSGAMAARAAAGAGLDTVVFERKKEVGVPVACGEGISDFSLENAGLKRERDWVECDVKGIRFMVPNGKCFLIPIPGMNIHRARFDQHIARLAEKNGAEMRLSSEVTDLKRTGGGWKLRVGDGTVAAMCVVAADGPHSPTAVKVGLDQNTKYVPAAQYKLEGSDIADTDWLKFYFSSHFPQGYGWVFQRSDHANVGAVARGSIKKVLDAFVRREGLEGREVRETNAGPIPIGGPLERIAGDDILLTGDAAGLVNPCTYGGIHAALWSGRAAGEAAVSRVKDGDEGAFLKYQERVHGSPFCDPVLMEGSKGIFSVPDHVWDFVGDISEGQAAPSFISMPSFIGMLKHPSILTYLGTLRKMRKAAVVYRRYGW